MEHRCDGRVLVTLPATVHKADGTRVPVTIRNLSRGGAFVSLPAGQGRLQGMLQLEWTMPGEPEMRYRWRAYVIHHRPDGAGLMFDDRGGAA